MWLAGEHSQGRKWLGRCLERKPCSVAQSSPSPSPTQSTWSQGSLQLRLAAYHHQDWSPCDCTAPLCHLERETACVMVTYCQIFTSALPSILMVIFLHCWFYFNWGGANGFGVGTGSILNVHSHTMLSDYENTTQCTLAIRIIIIICMYCAPLSILCSLRSG